MTTNTGTTPDVRRAVELGRAATNVDAVVDPVTIPQSWNQVLRDFAVDLRRLAATDRLMRTLDEDLAVMPATWMTPTVEANLAGPGALMRAGRDVVHTIEHLHADAVTVAAHRAQQLIDALAAVAPIADHHWQVPDTWLADTDTTALWCPRVPAHLGSASVSRSAAEAVRRTIDAHAELADLWAHAEESADGLPEHLAEQTDVLEERASQRPDRLTEWAVAVAGDLTGPLRAEIPSLSQ